jgi:glycosyltransferase involved in cell wall biosynthesis
MKISYFIDHLRPDGAQFVLCQLVEGLGQRSHVQTVFCLNNSWNEELVARLKNAGAKVVIVGKWSLFLGYGLLWVLFDLWRGKYDAVITNLFVSDVIGRTLTRLAVVPRVVTIIHTRDEFYRPWQRWLVRQTIRWADVVTVVSRGISEFAVREEGVPPARLLVVPNTIRVDEYRVAPQNPGEVRAELGIKPHEYLVGSLGRLTHQKGYDVLLQAIAMLNREQVHLLIAGIGEEETNLQRQAAALSISSQVHLLGYRSDVPAILKNLDLYVQPSRYEGMSLAILQAMAATCPVVATAVDGALEQIVDGEHGWLVPAEDPQALASAISAALADPAEAHRRGLNAAERVLAEFNETKMIETYEQILSGRK